MVRVAYLYNETDVDFPEQGLEKHHITSSESVADLEAEKLKLKIIGAMDDIRAKRHPMAIRDLKRLLFRCAATLNYSGKVYLCIAITTPS